MANNLGTAWIQIKPSMKGITASIRSELSGVGESEGKNVGSKFTSGFAARMGAIAGVTQQIFSKITSIISGQIDDAVYRADTLNRFPKVMEMMGYSAEDATVSVQKLRDGVAGIPTSLADVVSGTQRLATITGDINKASDWALAISDAMLITTGDVNEASRGMQQFVQILSRGKPAGDDWNTVMEVASPIMNQLAHSLGYTSAALGGDFYTALQKGTLSIDDMMTALVDLDQNGSESFSSLHELAKTSTGGIETAMTSLRQGISNAIVDIIQTIGAENITAIIDSIKTAIVGLVSVIGNLVSFIQANWAWLEPIFSAILVFLGALGVIFAAGKIYAGLVAIFTLISTNPIVFAISAIIAAIALVITHFDEIKTVVTNVFQILGTVIGTFGEWVGSVFSGIWDTVTGIFSNIGNFFANVWNTIASIFTGIGVTIGEAVSGAFKSVVNGILTFIENFINSPIDILNTFIGAINDAFGWIGVNLGKIDRISLPRLYTGGIVQGVGTDTSDSNLYALSKGEYVIRAAAAREIGYDNLNRMNETGEISGGGQTVNIVINGYNKSPEELANIISRKIAFNQRGVIG